MSEFTMNTPAGPFHVDEVYIEYDGPRLFACHDDGGVQYVGTWVEETPEANTWVFTPVTFRDAFALRCGELPLRTLMLRPMGGGSLMVRLSADRALQYSKRVLPADIPVEYLPDEGACLPREEGEPLLLTSTIVDYASATNREALDVFLGSAVDPQDNRIDASKLGGVLSALPSLVRSFSQRAQRRIPLNVPDYGPGRLSVAGFVMGSFGVRFEASGDPNLFGETEATDAMAGMLRLLDAVSDVDELSRILADNPQAGPPVRQLLETVSKGDMEFRAEWGSPSGRSQSVGFSPNQSTAALAIIEQHSAAPEFKIHGRLVGLMADPYTFRLVAGSGRKYYGTYSPDILTSDIGSITLSQIAEGISCTATLVESAIPIPLGRRPHKRYVLLDISLD